MLPHFFLVIVVDEKVTLSVARLLSSFSRYMRPLVSLELPASAIDELPIATTHVVWLAQMPVPKIQKTHPHVLIADLVHRDTLSTPHVEHRLYQPTPRAMGTLQSCTEAQWLVADEAQMATILAVEWKRWQLLVPPLLLPAALTRDTNSYKLADLTTSTEIPVAPHPGGFGVPRRNHIHEGVDLYAPEGTPVIAMEAGKVIRVQAFTGASVGSPWWNETSSILVRGASGVLNYGELHPVAALSPGSTVRAGTLLGHLAPVLKVDKGRPMTMLHLERYKSSVSYSIKEWPLNTAHPEPLLDPTGMLLSAYRPYM